MNKLFLSLVIACFGTATASAQYVLPSTQMALTNEEQATPVTTSLGGSTDFSTPDATTLETPATWNTTTTAEPPRGRQKRYAPRRSFSPRIAALAELGVGGDFDINATLGAQLFHFFYLGGGLNMTYWYDNFNSDFNRTDVNFVINPRFEIPIHSIVTPYIDFKTGLSVNHSHSTYWSLGTGVQIKRFVVGLAYSVQNIRDYYVYNQRDIFNSAYHYYSNGALTLRLGMKF